MRKQTSTWSGKQWAPVGGPPNPVEELHKCESPITRPLRRLALGGHGGQAVELKASSRQLAGGAHGTFHVVGAGRICQPPVLHKPLVPPARGSYPAPRGLEPVARDPGAAGAPEVAARRPFLARNGSTRELYGSRSGCHVWRSIFVEREAVLGAWLASAVPSRPLRK